MIGGLDPKFAEIGMNYEIDVPTPILIMNLTYDRLVKLIDDVVDNGDIELYYSLEEILRASIFYHNKIKEYEDNVQ